MSGGVDRMGQSEVRSVAKFQRWIEPEGLTLLEGWARDGLNEMQIAHNCGINRDTLYEWKKKYPEISKALNRGKEVVDYEVENALLRRALGYEYTEVTVEESDRGAKRRESTKHMAPDVGAQTLWLKNRRPDKWREKPREDAGAAGDESGVVLLPPVEGEP